MALPQCSFSSSFSVDLVFHKTYYFHKEHTSFYTINSVAYYCGATENRNGIFCSFFPFFFLSFSPLPFSFFPSSSTFCKHTAHMHIGTLSRTLTDSESEYFCFTYSIYLTLLISSKYLSLSKDESSCEQM